MRVHSRLLQSRLQSQILIHLESHVDQLLLHLLLPLLPLLLLPLLLLLFPGGKMKILLLLVRCLHSE